jgi:hypothetical protein
MAITTVASHRHPIGEELSMSGDEEQRVVDADSEPDHACDLRGPRRYVDQMRNERHQTDRHCEAEERQPNRQAHCDDGTERDEQHHDCCSQPDQLAELALRLLEREEQVAAHIDGELGKGSTVVADRMKIIQVGCAEVLDHRVLEADQRHSPIA